MTTPKQARLLQSGEYDRMFSVEDHHWWYQALHRLVLSTLSRELPPSSKVLDIGSGTGRLVELLQGRGYRACGLEPSSRALTLAARRPGRPSFKQGLSTRLPWRPRTFHAVCLMDVLYLLTPEQIQVTLGEVHRVLRPGGLFLFHSATYPWLAGAHDVAVRTHRRYLKAELAAFMDRCGFQKERLTHRMTLFLPPVALARLLSRFTRPGPHPRGDVAPPGPLGQWIGSKVMAAEGRLLDHVDLPAGVSVWGVYRKPA